MKTINLTIPQNWKDLSDNQRIRLMKAVNSRLRGKLLTLYVFTVLAIPNYFNVKAVWQTIVVLRNLKVSQLLPFISWVFELDDLVQFALSMQEVLTRINEQSFNSFILRIGAACFTSLPDAARCRWHFPSLSFFLSFFLSFLHLVFSVSPSPILPYPKATSISH